MQQNRSNEYFRLLYSNKHDRKRHINKITSNRSEAGNCAPIWAQTELYAKWTRVGSEGLADP